MGVSLDDDEVWAYLEGAMTGIAVTLRRDGTPMALPTWFVVHERRIYLRTPARAKKVERVRRDPRGAFLAESGTRWAELTAVHLTGQFSVVADPVRGRLIDDLLDAKYAGLRTATGLMPEASQRHYAGEKVHLRFDHDERILSWNNRKLRGGPVG
jgi:hypothetical protein